MADDALNVSKIAATNTGNGKVTITAAALAPTITGAGSTIYANAGSTTDAPFAGVTIADANLNNPTDTLNITLSDPNASLAAGTAVTGVTFSNPSAGVYTLSGLAANVTSELDALTLNAPATLTGRQQRRRGAERRPLRHHQRLSVGSDGGDDRLGDGRHPRAELRQDLRLHGQYPDLHRPDFRLLRHNGRRRWGRDRLR